MTSSQILAEPVATASASVDVGRVDHGAVRLREPSYPRRHRSPRWASLLRRAAIPVGILVLWWALTATGAVPASVLPPLSSVAVAGWDTTVSGELGASLAVSLTRVFAGVAIGASLGLLLGLASGLSRIGEELVDGSLQIIRAIPFLAIVPLFIAWFGIEETFKVLVIAFATIAPMYAYVYLAVRGIDRKLVEAARGYGLSGIALVRGVILPLSLPGILMALRISLSISIGALIAAENIGTRVGLGYLVSLAQQYNRVDYLFLCVVIYAVLGLLFDGAVRLAEYLLLPWRRGVALR